MTLLTKTLWNTSSGLLASFGGLATSVIVAQVLGPEGLGDFAFFAWVATFGASTSCLGFNISVAQRIADYRGRQDTDSVEAIVRWAALRCFAIVFGSVALTCSVWLLLPADPPHFIVIAVATSWGLQAIAMFARGVFTGHEHYKSLFVAAIPAFALQIVVSWVGGRLFGVAGALLAPGFASVPIVWLLIRQLRPPLRHSVLSPRDTRAMTRYSLGLWLASLVSAFVWTRCEILFLEWYCGALEVARFSIAVSVAGIVSQLAGLLSGALMPRFTLLLCNSSSNALASAYRSTTTLVSTFVAAVSSVGVAIAPIAVPALFGRECSDAVPIVQTCLIGAFIAGCAAPGSALVQSSGRSRFFLISGGLGVLLGIGWGVMGVPAFGAAGAALGRVTIQLLMVTLGSMYLWSRFGCPLPVNSVARSMAGPVAVLIVSTSVSLTIGTQQPALLNHAIAITAAAACLASFVVTRPIPTEDRDAICRWADSLPRSMSLPISYIMHRISR